MFEIELNGHKNPDTTSALYSIDTSNIEGGYKIPERTQTATVSF